MLPSRNAAEVVKLGKELAAWLTRPLNSTAAEVFSNSLAQQLGKCIPLTSTAQPLDQRGREAIWSSYHHLRCSQEYTAVWQAFFLNLGIVKAHPLFWQIVGDGMLAQIVKKKFPLPAAAPAQDSASEGSTRPSLTLRDMNALRYAAGYVPRAVFKKLNLHPSAVNTRLQKCLQDLLQESSGNLASEEWLDLVDRGGLCRVNDTAFSLFQAMELEVRSHLQRHAAVVTENFKEVVTRRVFESDEVKTIWTWLSNEWEDEDSKLLFRMIVELFVTVRGFSYASAWIEQHKINTAKTLQKSKGLRKAVK